MLSLDQGGDLPLRLQFKTAFLRRSNRLLLQDQGFTCIVCLDELHQDQHCPRLAKANPYPDVHRIAIPVHEHFLGATELLAHGIVDRVTDAPLGLRRPCAARTRSLLHCCLVHFFLLSRLPGSGMSGRGEAGGLSARFGDSQGFFTLRAGRQPTSQTGSRALDVVGVLGKPIDDHHAKRYDHHR